ncbi:hypothetical protein BJY01DRAFT_243979 [Aspergillus pseudoustus]|uniref:Major facilitator superfamily domain-containing protein n=1 Tax=Aspergillus pseudoustus TaxID=1810923 RepID=A0ABR4KNE3_9EURO
MGLSFVYFFPTITQSLGYNTTNTVLLAALPWIWAALIALPDTWHAHRTGERFLHYLWPALACIVGYIFCHDHTFDCASIHLNVFDDDWACFWLPHASLD